MRVRLRRLASWLGYAVAIAIITLHTAGCVLMDALLSPADGQAQVREVVVGGLSWFSFLLNQVNEVLGAVPPG